MRKKHEFNTIDDLRRFYDIFPVEEEDCRLLNGEKLSKIHEDIFLNKDYRSTMEKMLRLEDVGKIEYCNVLFLTTALSSNILFNSMFFLLKKSLKLLGKSEI